MKSFPQELVDKIIDDVGDILSWKQCSLVCRAWIPATRRHFFSAVDLKRVGLPNYHPKSARTDRFLHMLDNGLCTLTPFVTRLSLDCVDANPAKLHQAFQILSKLTGVISLQLNVWWFELGMEPIQDWFSHLTGLSELMLNRVSFESTRQLFSLLEFCSSLTALNIMASSWKSEYDHERSQEFYRDPMSLLNPKLPRKVPVIPYSHSSSIQRLHLGCPKMDFLDVLRTAPSSFSCRSVQLDNIVEDDAQSIGMFLQHLGESLEHLEFGFRVNNSRGGEAFCDHVDLRHNTGLHSIHITDIIYGHPFTGCQHLTSLPSILGRCASRHLTDITFSIYLEAFREFYKFVWPALDDSLMSLPLDSPVTLTFYIPDFPLDHPERAELLPALLTDIQSLLPNSSPRFNVLVVPGGENPRAPFPEEYE